MDPAWFVFARVVSPVLFLVLVAILIDLGIRRKRARGRFREVMRFGSPVVFGSDRARGLAIFVTRWEYERGTPVDPTDCSESARKVVRGGLEIRRRHEQRVKEKIFQLLGCGTAREWGKDYNEKVHALFTYPYEGEIAIGSEEPTEHDEARYSLFVAAIIASIDELADRA